MFFGKEKKRMTPFFKNANKIAGRMSKGLAGISNIARIGSQIADPNNFKGIQNKTVGEISNNILEKRKELTNQGQNLQKDLTAPIQFERM